MSTENSSPNFISKVVLDALPKLVEILSPLSPEDRQRVISAAMVLFGQSAGAHLLPRTVSHAEQTSMEDGISAKASLWMKKYSITRQQLDHVFSIESDSIDVIAARMPASGKRQQTVQAYVICGLKAFLKTGDAAFTDSEGRELCDKVGCYDVANHSNYRKAFGNLLSGTKESGWRLTNPGLNEAAKFVKLLSPAEATI